jgi:hypothetical protein
MARVCRPIPIHIVFHMLLVGEAFDGREINERAYERLQRVLFWPGSIAIN